MTTVTAPAGRPAAAPVPPAGSLTHREFLSVFVGLMLGMFLAPLDQTSASAVVHTTSDDQRGLSVQFWVTTFRATGNTPQFQHTPADPQAAKGPPYAPMPIALPVELRGRRTDHDILLGRPISGTAPGRSQVSRDHRDGRGDRPFRELTGEGDHRCGRYRPPATGSVTHAFARPASQT